MLLHLQKVVIEVQVLELNEDFHYRQEAQILDLLEMHQTRRVEVLGLKEDCRLGSGLLVDQGELEVSADVLVFVARPEDMLAGYYRSCLPGVV